MLGTDEELTKDIIAGKKGAFVYDENGNPIGIGILFCGGCGELEGCLLVKEHSSLAFACQDKRIMDKRK